MQKNKMTLIKQQNSQNFKWIGKKLENSNLESFFDNKILYSGFKLGEWIVNVGDFVLVDMKQDDQFAQLNYSVVRIKALYEDDHQTIDSCNALVQWYTWPMHIPQDCFYNDIIFDFELDIIEDFRIANPIVNISNMVGSCHVLYGSVEDEPSDVIHTGFEDYGIDGMIYLCRYRIIQNSESNSFIEPVEEMPDCDLLLKIEKEHDNSREKNTNQGKVIHPTKKYSAIMKTCIYKN